MFSASDAAFSGFRVSRQHWRALLVWSVLIGVISIGTALLMVNTVGPQLTEFNRISASGAEPDPEAALAMLQSMAPFIGIALPLSMIYYSVLYAGVNRLVLRPDDGGFAHLKLGGDEVRQFLVTLCLALVLVGVYVGGLVAVILLVVAAKAALGGGLATAVGILAGLALAIGLIVLAVRLSLAPAQTFATRRLNVFGSWSLTRGHFWPILGAYVLAFIMLMIVSGLFMFIVMLAAVSVGGGFGAMAQVFKPDMTSVAALYSPAFIAYQACVALAAPHFMMIMRVPAPTIYKALTSGGA